MQLKLTVQGGKVACPQRGRTDIGTCVACRHFEAVEPSGGAEVVVCNPVRFSGATATSPDLCLK